MDMAGGVQPLPYGHITEAAIDIEGLTVSQLTIPVFRHRLTPGDDSYLRII